MLGSWTLRLKETLGNKYASSYASRCRFQRRKEDWRLKSEWADDGLELDVI